MLEYLYTEKLVSYTLNKRMTTNLVCGVLNMAIKNKRSNKGLVVHSDKGSQYYSYGYHRIIKQHKFTGLMSSKGNSYDNTSIDSF